MSSKWFSRRKSTVLAICINVFQLICILSSRHTVWCADIFVCAFLESSLLFPPILPSSHRIHHKTIFFIDKGTRLHAILLENLEYFRQIKHSRKSQLYHLFLLLLNVQTYQEFCKMCSWMRLLKSCVVNAIKKGVIYWNI